MLCARVRLPRILGREIRVESRILVVDVNYQRNQIGGSGDSDMLVVPDSSDGWVAVGSHDHLIRLRKLPLCQPTNR